MNNSLTRGKISLAKLKWSFPILKNLSKKFFVVKTFLHSLKFFESNVSESWNNIEEILKEGVTRWLQSGIVELKVNGSNPALLMFI